MTAFAGIIWRAAFDGQSPLIAASAPEGRFLHSGQAALYASLTPEGCRVAIWRYVAPDDPPRLIHPLHLMVERVIDLAIANLSSRLILFFVQGVFAALVRSDLYIP